MGQPKNVFSTCSGRRAPAARPGQRGRHRVHQSARQNTHFSLSTRSMHEIIAFLSPASTCVQPRRPSGRPLRPFFLSGGEGGKTSNKQKTKNNSADIIMSSSRGRAATDVTVRLRRAAGGAGTEKPVSQCRADADLDGASKAPKGARTPPDVRRRQRVDARQPENAKSTMWVVDSAGPVGRPQPEAPMTCRCRVGGADCRSGNGGRGFRIERGRPKQGRAGSDVRSELST